MIKKTLLIFIALFICWNIVLIFNPNLNASQHQWQDNFIAAEKYLYSTNKDNKVIVGSSLANRLIMDSLPGFYNLSFGGQGIYDGFEILLRRKEKPKYVFIEINVMFRDPNKGFISEITSNASYQLKNNLISFRSDKKPIDLIDESFITPNVKKYHENLMSIYYSKKKKVNNTESKERNDESFNMMLNQQKNGFDKVVEQEEIDSKMNLLSSYIEKLNQAGVEVIFFEMPVHKSIQDLLIPNLIRDLIKSKFPNNKLILAPEQFSYFRTTDGVHLMVSEAEKYTPYFREQMLIIAENH